MTSGKWVVRPAGGQIEGGAREGRVGKESTRMARMPRRGLEGLGGGKESTLKSVKTASWTGTLGERMGGDNLDNSGQLFARCAA